MNNNDLLNEKLLVFHIGYPKTATTFLQEEVFNNLNSIFYLNKYPQALKNSIDGILVDREHIFKDKLDLLKHEINKPIIDNLNANMNSILISHEAILGNSMCYRFNPIPYIWSPDPSVIARKIDYLFSDFVKNKNFKILLTIRRQDTILMSWYAEVFQYFSEIEFTKTFDLFIEYFSKNPNELTFDMLDYNKIIKIYENIFGTDSINILIYEELKQDANLFSSKLSNILNIQNEEVYNLLINSAHQNVRNSKDGYRVGGSDLFTLLSGIKRKLTKNSLGLGGTYLAKVLKNMKFGSKIDTSIKLSDKQRESILNIFGNSNRLLSQKYNLSLDKYGYYK